MRDERMKLEEIQQNMMYTPTPISSVFFLLVHSQTSTYLSTYIHTYIHHLVPDSLGFFFDFRQVSNFDDR